MVFLYNMRIKSRIHINFYILQCAYVYIHTDIINASIYACISLHYFIEVKKKRKRRSGLTERVHIRGESFYLAWDITHQVQIPSFVITAKHDMRDTVVIERLT